MAKTERGDAWWAAARREYIEKNDMLMDAYPDWEWCAPVDFMRAIFPAGFLQERGEMVPWDEPGGGRPNAIAMVITNRAREVETPSGGRRETRAIERRTVTDDLDAVEELVASSNADNSSVFCAPVSYFGKARTAENARFLHAFAVDLDGVHPEQLANLLKQVRNGHDPDMPRWTSVPQPTFIVNSGTGLHLYYLLDEPVPLVPGAVPFLQALKRALTDYVWRDTTSTLAEKQFQGIYQAFRMPGTPTKLNGKGSESKRKDKYEAVAFVHNGADGRPFRCSVAHLADYVGARLDKREHAALLEMARTGGRTPLERARELWPDWYRRRIVEGAPKGRWTCKRDLYEWWMGQVRANATDHHRYWCLNALAAYADKCGVPYDELEADALSLVPLLEGLTEREDNHFSEEDALAAIACYADGEAHRLTRERIEQRTAIDIPPNKRNGRSQEQHMAYLNGLRKMRRDVLGEDEYRNNGRPKGSGTKRDVILAYAEAHPGASHSEIARVLGVSRPTVIKWLKTV